MADTDLARWRAFAEAGCVAYTDEPDQADDTYTLVLVTSVPDDEAGCVNEGTPGAYARLEFDPDGSLIGFGLYDATGSQGW